MTMTPDRHAMQTRHAIQAVHAPEHGLGRQGSVYDRLMTEWEAAGRTVPGATWDSAGRQRRRSSREARAEIPRVPGGPYPY